MTFLVSLLHYLYKYVYIITSIYIYDLFTIQTNTVQFVRISDFRYAFIFTPLILKINIYIYFPNMLYISV